MVDLYQGNARVRASAGEKVTQARAAWGGHPEARRPGSDKMHLTEDRAQQPQPDGQGRGHLEAFQTAQP